MVYDNRPVYYYSTGTAFTTEILLDGSGLRLVATPIGGGMNVQIPGLNGKTALFTGRITDDPFPVLMNTDLWNPIKVPYPANTFPMDSSIKWGVDWIVNDITTNLKKGAPWGVGGNSQGAAVASYIYNEMRTGRLTDWASGFITGICTGNPMRQVNYTNPWSSYSGAFDVPGSTTGGHGCFPASYRLTNCDQNNWIEFTNPWEIVTGCGDSPLGMWWQAGAGAFLLQTLITPGTPGSFLFNAAQFLVGATPIIINLVTNTIGSVISQFFPAFSGFPQIPTFLDELLKNIMPGTPGYFGPGPITDLEGNVLVVPGGGHALYPAKPPYGYSGTETSMQLALKYLEDRAIEWATSPSVLPPKSSIAGWSTTLIPPAA